MVQSFAKFEKLYFNTDSFLKSYKFEKLYFNTDSIWQSFILTRIHYTILLVFGHRQRNAWSFTMVQSSSRQI